MKRIIDRSSGIKVNIAAVHLISLGRLPRTKAMRIAPSAGRKSIVVR
jgi:hypothetical protein